jgi:hypothetical protein
MAVSTVLRTVGLVRTSARRTIYLPRRNVLHCEKTASDISPPSHKAIELCV